MNIEEFKKKIGELKYPWSIDIQKSQIFVWNPIYMNKIDGFWYKSETDTPMIEMLKDSSIEEMYETIVEHNKDFIVHENFVEIGFIRENGKPDFVKIKRIDKK